MLTVAQQKALEETERREAVKRKDDYRRNVVEPEDKELSQIVCERLHADDAVIDYTGCTRPTFVTLVVDTRYNVLDPEHPVPEVKEGKYKIRAQKNYYTRAFYVHVDVWDEHAVWAGSYQSGKPGWKSIDDTWHKVQVLRELVRSDKRLNDPTTKEGALAVLLRYCEQQAKQGGLSQEVQAALLVMQNARRDGASRQPYQDMMALL